jgi:RNase P/RNase MRP subunit p30
LTEVEMSSKPKRLVLLNTGAMRPWSVWTAKDMLTFLYYLMY